MMFYEKWFDKGDLIMYSPKEGFACYDDAGNMSTVDYKADPQIGVFLGYSSEESWDVCEIFIAKQEKIIIVPQHDITLLSKNTEL